jgi:toluene monooxygenase system ferredoxin subunit
MSKDENSWFKVCHQEEISGDKVKKFSLDEVEILIAKSKKGFVALPTMCPHMAEPLNESGLISDGLLTCSKHLWQWDLSTGESKGVTEVDLLTYSTKIVDEYIWVYMDNELKYEYEEEEDDDFEW